MFRRGNYYKILVIYWIWKVIGKRGIKSNFQNSISIANCINNEHQNTDCKREENKFSRDDDSL